ncbi:MAG: hypothetical protein AB7Q04_13430 [Steroidobacteraceae bacterium]
MNNDEILEALRMLYAAFFDMPKKTQEQFEAIDNAAKFMRQNHD